MQWHWSLKPQIRFLCIYVRERRGCMIFDYSYNNLECPICWMPWTWSRRWWRHSWTYSPHRNTSCWTNGRWRCRTQSQRRCRICEFELDLYVQKKSAHCAWMNIREAVDVTQALFADESPLYWRLFRGKKWQNKRSLLKIRKNNRTDCHPQKTGHCH